VGLRSYLAGVATGVAFCLVVVTAWGGFTDARNAILEDSVIVERTQRIAAVAEVERERQAREAVTMELQVSTARWDEERRTLTARTRAAAAEAEGLRSRLSALATPDMQPLLDSLYVAHEAEVGTLHARLRVERDENAVLWTERRALLLFAERQDTALAAALAEIRAHEALTAGLRRQLRPTFWSRAVGSTIWTAAAVGAGWACSEMTRDRGDLALLGCAGGAAVAIVVVR
jgi:hypothetical protein